MPGSSVQRNKEYEVTCYQDFGLVDECDFTRLTSVTPKQAGKSPCPLPLLGPSGKNVNLYLMSLRGLPIDEIMAMRRLRISFFFARSYLSARDQLLQNQGNNVFDYVHGMHAKSQPMDLNKTGLCRRHQQEASKPNTTHLH